jgi:peptidyl-prolyl cis-trans isomerase C
MKMTWRILLIVPALALILPACSKKEKAGAPASKIEGGSEVVATYGDKKLTLDQFGAEVEKLPPQVKPLLSAPDRRKQFLENFVLSQLLIEEAKKKGLDKDEEIKNQLEEMKKRLLLQRVFQDLQKSVTISHAEVKEYWEKHPEEFSTAQIRVSHILLDDEAAAKKLLQQVRAKPDSFADLARKFSKDTATAPSGGDLNFFGHGRMVPEFEKAAFALKNVGDISDVVKTPFGYHIIKLTEKKPGEPRPFDQVKEEIRSKLLQKKQREKVEAYFAELKRKAGVKIDEKVLAKYNPGPLTGGPAALPGQRPMVSRPPTLRPSLPAPPAAARPTTAGKKSSKE